jgi:hypothetical protein
MDALPLNNNSNTKEISVNDGFQGGKPAGSLYTSAVRNYWTVDFEIVGIERTSRNFSFKKYGGSEQAKEAAEKFRTELSEAHGLMKNQWKIIDDVLYVKLTQEKVMKTDPKALLLVDSHTWRTEYLRPRDIFYALTNLNRRLVKGFHNLYTGFSYVDHINGDGLDNRSVDLRATTHVLNARNHKISKSNTSGTAGVHLLNNKQWVARWHEDDGRILTRKFSISLYGDEDAKQLAIEARKEAESRLGIVVRERKNSSE